LVLQLGRCADSLHHFPSFKGRGRGRITLAVLPSRHAIHPALLRERSSTAIQGRQLETEHLNRISLQIYSQDIFTSRSIFLDGVQSIQKPSHEQLRSYGIRTDFRSAEVEDWRKTCRDFIRSGAHGKTERAIYGRWTRRLFYLTNIKLSPSAPLLQPILDKFMLLSYFIMDILVLRTQWVSD
jgi:hypothetical protein